MGWDINVDNNISVFEIRHHQKEFASSIAQKGVLALQMIVYVHEIEKDTVGNGFLATRQQQCRLMNTKKLLLIIGQFLERCPTKGVYTP